MTAAPEWMEFGKVVFALAFVIGLIFLLKTLIQKTGLDRRITGSKGTARLGVVETMYLDTKHRLVLVRRDDREHLLLLGGVNDLLIESPVAGNSGEGKAV